MKQKKVFMLSVLCLSLLLLNQCISEQNKKVEKITDTKKYKKLNFFINIHAPVEVVFQTVIDSTHFNDWTSAFGPSSTFKGNWGKGSKMIFTADMEDGTQVGMISRIKEHIPNQLISIEHVGMLQNGVEIMDGEEVESFKGSIENYSFTTNGQITTMGVNTDVFIEMDSFYNKTWPVALARIKELCEQK
jgi:hypothetical protein